ncbi:hypothetical protein [Ferruginibacter sp.]
MKSHNGMRPQDIVVLLKVLKIPEPNWQYRDVAIALKLSLSEISESLQRSHIAGLIDDTKKKVYRENLMEFIEHGLHYVFPVLPGTMVTGIPTAHSHPFFKKKFKAEFQYVWDADKGDERGLAITPLYKNVAEAVLIDETLYLLLAAIDIYRVGRVRELKVAKEVLEQHILS